VVLIVDGHPAHRARIVRDFIAANPDQIELQADGGGEIAALPGAALHRGDIRESATLNAAADRLIIRIMESKRPGTGR